MTEGAQPGGKQPVEIGGPRLQYDPYQYGPERQEADGVNLVVNDWV
jgi:hypothetical protein